MTDMPPPSRSGTLLGGRYRLEQVIATGGMAQVWEATDEILARRVAVKLLHAHLAADDGFVARFRAEAVAAARLAHPSIVAIYDTCSSDGCEAIVMELIRGTNLRRYLDERGPLDVPEAAGIIAQVAEALEIAHRSGLVHRDVKPANILLADDGRVLVADFGIAKAAVAPGGAASGTDLTTTGQTLGTVKYLAPEQVEGNEVDARTDVYALGLVLFETLCGRLPFTGDTDAATALARLHQEPLRPRQCRAGIPRAIEDVLLRAIARTPDKRFASADEFRTALLAACRGEVAAPRPIGNGEDRTIAVAVASVDVHPSPDQTSPGFRQSERSWLVPTAVIVLIALALGLAGVLFGRTEAGQDLIDRVTGSDNGSGLPITIQQAAVFDPPPGDGHENDDEVGAAIDGDLATAWSTEGYDSRALGGLKAGVGLYLVLGSRASLDTLTIITTTEGWSASIYVADEPANDLAGWGEPVATGSGLAQEATFDLNGRDGAVVLVWITDLGDEPPNVHTRIAEAAVR